MKEEMKYIDYAESWYRTWCPYCGVVNWHCNGNESDVLGYDVDAVKCRACKKTYGLGSPDEILDEIRGDNELMVENGVEMLETKEIAE